MEKPSLIVQALVRATATFLYIVLVVTLISHAERIFGERGDAYAPVFMLLLFLISATVTSLLVLGKPATLYLSGAKKEALSFLLAVLGWLALFLVIVGVFMALR